MTRQGRLAPEKEEKKKNKQEKPKKAEKANLLITVTVSMDILA